MLTVRPDSILVSFIFSLNDGHSTDFRDAMTDFLNEETFWCKKDTGDICYLANFPQEFVVNRDVNGDNRITDIPLEF